MGDSDMANPEEISRLVQIARENIETYLLKQMFYAIGNDTLAIFKLKLNPEKLNGGAAVLQSFYSIGTTA